MELSQALSACLDPSAISCVLLLPCPSGLCVTGRWSGSSVLLVRKTKVSGQRDPLSLFFFLIYLFIYFWLHWVFVAAHGLPLVTVSEGYSSLRCTGFSLWWLVFVEEHGL